MADTKVMQCDHCGKQAVFIVRGNGTQHGAKVGDTDTETQELTTWQICECSNCNKPTLEEIIATYQLVETLLTNSNSKATMAFEWHPTTAKRTVLYPGKTPLTNLPKTIEKKYLEALKVRDIQPSACAVLAGRTLEAICNHEKAAGRTLSDKLNNLMGSDRIPKTLAEMAHQLRQIRNLGAHDADDEVTGEDASIMMDFLDTILEYLYVAPAKVAAVKARLRKTP